MGLTVTKEHLQYPVGMMLNAPYPHMFYYDAEIFAVHFKLIDRRATVQEAVRTRRKKIDPSVLGGTIILFSKRSFEDSFINLPGIAKLTSELDEAPKTQVEDFRKSLSRLFLNLAAFYLLPLYKAAREYSPYTNAEWIKRFLKEKADLSEETRKDYLVHILKLLRNIDASEAKIWLAPYAHLAGKLGQNGVDHLLLSIAMFLAALEEMPIVPQGQSEVPFSGEGKEEIETQIPQIFLDAFNDSNSKS